MNTASRRGTRCARKSNRARCRSTPRSRNSSGAPLAARRAARNGFSRSIRGSPPHRCRRRWCSETPRPSNAGSPISPRSRPQPGGPMNWEPLLYACHTSHARGRPRAARGPRRDCQAPLRARREPERRVSLELASRASAHGAVGVPSARSGICRWRKCCSQAGANPTDGVTSHITSGGGNLDALELLHRYRLNVNGIPGGVPPLVYMMLWADTPAGARWLLDHGADANLRLGRRRRGAPARRRPPMGRADGRALSSRTAPTSRAAAPTAPRRTRWPS